MKLIKFKTINSTNTYALNRFQELEDMTAIAAKTQTDGRGRFERKWLSPDCENIYLSIVLKQIKKEFAPNLTQYLCVTAAKVIEKYSVKVQIKWPNDLLVEGKKIAGILCEAHTTHNISDGFVLGIGININMNEDVLRNIDKPAASLNLETGTNIDKQKFLDSLLIEFEAGFDGFAEKGFACIREDYLKRINFLGKNITIRKRDDLPEEKFQALDINESGNLVVLNKEKQREIIFSGDLIL